MLQKNTEPAKGHAENFFYLVRTRCYLINQNPTLFDRVMKMYSGDYFFRTPCNLTRSLISALAELVSFWAPVISLEWVKLCSSNFVSFLFQCVNNIMRLCFPRHFWSFIQLTLLAPSITPFASSEHLEPRKLSHRLSYSVSVTHRSCLFQEMLRSNDVALSIW